MNDLKLAFRQLLKNKGFALVAILILGVGMAANTAVFGLVDAALYRPLGGVGKPDELVALEVPNRGATFSRDSLDVLRESKGTFQDFAGYDRGSTLLFAGNAQTRVQTEFVSGNFFTLLGVKPFLGRLLDESDRSAPLVVISHRLWRTRFDSARDIVGHKLEVNGEPFTIVGVADDGFGGMQPLAPVSAWLSCELPKPHLPDWNQKRSTRWLAVFGRMKPGVALAAARDSLLPLQSQVLEPWMLQNNGSLQATPCGRGAIPGASGQSGVRLISLFLFTVVVLVLAVACANLASLLLSRGLNRRREIAIRMALGAPRWLLIRQLLVETLLLSLMGGLGGLVLSTWGVRLATLALPKISRSYDIDLSLRYDWRIIGFTLAASLLVALVCGLIPAWRGTQVDCQAALKDETLGIGPRRRWFELRNLLIVSQVAVSVALLVGGGVMLRSLSQIQNQKFAFDYDHCVVTALWDKDAATSDAEHARMRRELLESARTLPGVTTAALGNHPPLVMGTRSTSVSDPQNGNSSEALIGVVTPGFFETLKIPVVLGRDFSVRDVGHSNDVVVVNESLAANLWPGQNPLGRSIHYDRDTDYQVIGVVRDACYWSATDTTRPGFYLCEGELTRDGGGYLIVRTAQDTRPLRGLVASLVRRADPGHEQPYVADYADFVAVGLIAQRTAAWVLGLASAIGLALVAAGLYGVLSYHIAQRTREIGIRMALGAGRGHVMRSMLWRGISLVAIGLVIGSAVGVFGASHMDKVLFKTSPADPATLLGVCVLMTGAALLACWLPARRAARVDPMVALRSE